MFAPETLTVVYGKRGERTFYAGATRLTMAFSLREGLRPDGTLGLSILFEPAKGEEEGLRLEAEIRAVNASGIAVTRVQA